MRHDTGNKLGFLKAVTYFALKRPDLAGPFTEYLKAFFVVGRSFSCASFLAALKLGLRSWIGRAKARPYATAFWICLWRLASWTSDSLDGRAGGGRLAGILARALLPVSLSFDESLPLASLPASLLPLSLRA